MKPKISRWMQKPGSINNPTRHCFLGYWHASSEVAWGAKVKGTQTAVGDRCEVCSHLARSAYPLLQWSEILAKSKTEESFRAELLATREVTSGKRANHVSISGFRVETAFKLWSLEDLDGILVGKVLGNDEPLRAKDLELPLETLSQEGKELTGLLVREPGPKRVIVFAEQHTDMERLLHKPSQTYRANQGQDFSEWYRRDLRTGQNHQNTGGILKGVSEA